MLGSLALSSALLVLALAAKGGTQQAQSQKVCPLRSIPSEQQGVGPFSIDLVDAGYEMTEAGIRVMGGSPVGSRPPSGESVASCLKLGMGDQVRGALGDGTVVGAQCFPTNEFTHTGFKRQTAPDLGDAGGFGETVTQRSDLTRITPGVTAADGTRKHQGLLAVRMTGLLGSCQPSPLQQSAITWHP